MALLKIISGGQSGADRGGLEAGRLLNLPTGGWIPKGYRTENGKQIWLKSYGLQEHASDQYPPRTEQNVKDSDATVIFGNIEEPGSKLTLKLCLKHDKPYLHIRPAENDKLAEECFLAWLTTHEPKVLNVAGNRESKYRGLQSWVRDFLIQALSKRRI